MSKSTEIGPARMPADDLVFTVKGAASPIGATASRLIVPKTRISIVVDNVSGAAVMQQDPGDAMTPAQLVKTFSLLAAQLSQLCVQNEENLAALGNALTPADRARLKQAVRS